MKIGITTFQWSENYGAVLQAHALQFFLQERGHTVQIIDFRPPPSGAGLRRWLSSSPRGFFVKWEADPSLRPLWSSPVLNVRKDNAYTGGGREN